ncbi:MAG: RidA family protein [Cyclobacteriaceae bacterium]|nr:MAG: RidA family protein [Cyclobacteriaceae bacterium]
MKKPDKVTGKYQADKAPRPMGAYPHARRVGDFLYLSGIGPRAPQTDEVPGNILNDQGQVIAHDIEAQCHAVFENVKTVLESAGLRLDQLIDITVFLTDIAGDFERYNKVYAQYFGDIAPCRTTVGVSGLPSSIAIELKCIAHVGS